MPDISKKICEKKCYHTGKGNFFIVELVDDSGQRVEYEVYFKVSKSEYKGKLRLFIESAYVRDKQHHNSRPRQKKISFFVIAHNVKLGKGVRLPK